MGLKYLIPGHKVPVDALMMELADGKSLGSYLGGNSIGSLKLIYEKMADLYELCLTAGLTKLIHADPHRENIFADIKAREGDNPLVKFTLIDWGNSSSPSKELGSMMVDLLSVVKVAGKDLSGFWTKFGHKIQVRAGQIDKDDLTNGQKKTLSAVGSVMRDVVIKGREGTPFAAIMESFFDASFTLPPSLKKVSKKHPKKEVNKIIQLAKDFKEQRDTATKKNREIINAMLKNAINSQTNQYPFILVLLNNSFTTSQKLSKMFELLKDNGVALPE